MGCHPNALLFFLTVCSALGSGTDDLEGSCDVEESSCNQRTPNLQSLNHSLVNGEAERIVVPGMSHVYVSVKSTAKYHDSRLPLLVLTWLQTLEPGQVHIVTDSGSDDEVIQLAKNIGFHVTHSDCPADHQRQSLCCKSGVEYDQFYLALEKGAAYKWFCHFDDDMYVNTPALLAALEKFNPFFEDKIYFGRWPLGSQNREVPHKFTEHFPDHKRTTYRYATGAAYCISSSLMEELHNYLRGKALEENCHKLQLPDDMLIGTIVGAVLGYELTDEQLIVTHLNRLLYISQNKLAKLITISYGELKFTGKPVIKNVVNIPNAVFSEKEDHSRFFSYHCLLYPNTSWCGKDNIMNKHQ